jgi:excisionase family DNA binding protein
LKTKQLFVLNLAKLELRLRAPHWWVLGLFYSTSKEEIILQSSVTAASDGAVKPQTQFEPLLRVSDAAQLLGGMHSKTLMRLARNREVPGIKIGKCWFFRASSLNEWIRVQFSQHRPCLTEGIL